MALVFTYPFRPVLLNHAKQIVRFKRTATLIKTKETREFESLVVAHTREIIKTIPEAVIDFLESKKDRPLSIEFYIYLDNLMTKKSTLNKRCGDWDGFPKVMQDCLFMTLGLDDSQVTKGTVEKIQAKNDSTVVILS